ncbi:MAG: nucleotidyltransferase domain-containing protein [Terracidiphilus sp.]
MPTAEKLDELRMSWRPTPEKVDRVVRTAIEVVRPSRVFIFGSWARGEAATARDLDLAVLVPDERSDEIGELHRRLDSKLEVVRMSVDLILVSEGYFAQFGASINSVYHKIANQGKLVYEQRH